MKVIPEMRRTHAIRCARVNYTCMLLGIWLLFEHNFINIERTQS